MKKNQNSYYLILKEILWYFNFLIQKVVFTKQSKNVFHNKNKKSMSLIL